MSRLFIAVSAAGLLAVFSFAASAQTPPATTDTPSPPATQTPPATPPASPPASSSPTPAQPQVTPADPFGEEVTLEAKSMVYMKGTATWENAYETLVEAFRTISDYLEKQKIAPSDK